MRDIFNAIVLGIIEGLTEFVPVSSTGHLVIAMPLLGVDATARPWNVLLWVSQFAAIMAVIVYFWRDLWQRTFRPLTTRWQATPGLRVGPRARHVIRTEWKNHILVKLLVAMVPTTILALAFKDYLDPLESQPAAVAAALILGAGVMEWIDRRCRKEVPQELEQITLKQAFWIGVIQCLSMVPGVSRSGATIMGGMTLGLTPRVATEFSFYLAIPVMVGAAAKKLLAHGAELRGDDVLILLLGCAVSFLVALLVIAGFIGFVKRYRFTAFAVYRVVLGLIVLGLWYGGWFGGPG